MQHIKNSPGNVGKFAAISGAILALMLIGLLFSWLLGFVVRGIPLFQPQTGPLLTDNIRMPMAVMGDVIYAGNYAFNATNGRFLYTSDKQISSADNRVALTDPIQDNSQQNNVYALDSQTNRQLWTLHEGANLSNYVQIVNGIVYYFDGYSLQALDETSGAVLWKADHLTTTNADMYVFQGIAYLISEQEMVALRLSDHTILWRQHYGLTMNQGPQLSMQRVGNTLYILANILLNALDANTGALLWSISPADSYNQLKLLGIAGGNIFLQQSSASSGFIPGQLFVIQASTQHISNNWLADNNPGYPQFPPPPVGSNYVLSNDTLYMTSADTLYAFHANTGKVAWTVSGGGTQNELTVLGAQNGIVYTQTSLGIRAYAGQQGHLLWQVSTPIPSGSHAILGSDALYLADLTHTTNLYTPHFITALYDGAPVCTNTVNVFAIDAQSGAFRWQMNHQHQCQNANDLS